MDTKKSRNRQPDHPYHQFKIIPPGRERIEGELVSLFIQWKLLMEWREHATSAARAILLRRTGAVGITDETELHTLVHDAQRQIARRVDNGKSPLSFLNWLQDFSSKAPQKMEEARRLKGGDPITPLPIPTATVPVPPPTVPTPAPKPPTEPKSKTGTSSQCILQLGVGAISLPVAATITRTLEAVKILAPGAANSLVINTDPQTNVSIKCSTKTSAPLPLVPGWSVRCEANNKFHVTCNE